MAKGVSLSTAWIEDEEADDGELGDDRNADPRDGLISLKVYSCGYGSEQDEHHRDKRKETKRSEFAGARSP